MSTDVDSLSINMLFKANNSNGHNNTSASEEDDSDAVGAQDQDQPEDWSKFGSLWSPHHSSSFKSYNDFMDLSDFSTSMSMSMDTDLGLSAGMDYSYSSTMGIDPASLHFNPAAAGLGLGGGFGPAHDISTSFVDSYGAPVFSYQQQQPHHQQHTPLSTQGSASPESFTKDRRLSVTSSSSSSVSGVSLSPIPDNYTALSPPPSGYASDNISTKDELNPNSTADPEASNSNLYANDPAAELAHRVRQSAGMMLAVPLNGYGSSFQAGTNVSAGKLPIPRLTRPSAIMTPSYAKSTTTSSVSSSTTSSAASTPPPLTPPSTSHSPLNVSTSNSAVSASVPTPTTAALARPKTSHTTIERRYRTNLNARIQSLRMAVPALRVLEDPGGSKRIKKNIKGGVLVKGGGIGIGIECSEDGSVVDVIDERGFVDGVKVARKCSKANVLGKAVEYIRVLKRRERRLRGELAGVKVLVEGLVGGPALIREWEKEWRARFGGEEKDEEGEGDGDGDGEDEDSDDDDGDDDDEGAGRKRKRSKVASTSTGGGISKKADSKKKTALPLPPVVLLAGDQTGNLVPEKRKRGRPRKILPPPVTLEPVVNASAAHPPALLPAAVIVQRDGSGSAKQDEIMRPPEAMGQWQQQQQQSPQRFLLAVFALFSFFNSPLTSSSGRDHSTHNHHHHTGKVLTPIHPPLVSPEIVSQFMTTPTPVWKEYVQLFHLVVSFLVLASFVGNWFGFGVSGFRFSFEKRGWGLTSRRGGKDRKGNEDRFAEESVLSGEAGSLSHFERLQIYRSISARENASLSSRVGAAVVLNNASGVFGGLARMKARAIWDEARRKVHGTNKKVREEIVFGSMGVDEACERLAGCVKRGDPNEMSDGEREYDLIEVLACGVVKERVRSHLGNMFVDFVGGHEDEDEEGYDVVEQEEGKVEEEARRRKTVDASRELGGNVEEMGRLLERMWKIGVAGVDIRDVECVFSNTHSAGRVDEELKALFVALVLHARVFGDAASESSEETETERLSSSSDTVIFSSPSLLSPPPSPTSRLETTTMVTSKTKDFAQRAKSMLELRKVLGCRVFEGCVGVGAPRDERKVGGGCVEGLEEARDLVVDLIVDFERRDR